jgi:hypothetical protein
MFEQIDNTTYQSFRQQNEMSQQWALVVFDAFSGHSGEDFFQLLEANIMHVKVPSGCADELQPVDLSVNKSCKSYFREKFQRMVCI